MAEKIFLIATYVKQPLDPGMTRFRGYVTDEKNVTYKEQIAIGRKVKNRDIAQAGIILDVLERKIVKATWKPNSTFDELWDYFESAYKDYLSPISQILNPPPEVIVSADNMDPTATISSDAGPIQG